MNMLGERTDLVCPDCKALMKLIPYSKFGPFYGCTNYPKCKGSHKASEDDGSPLGVPANAETRKWRQKAIAAVDTLANHLPSASKEDCEAIIKLADRLN